MPYPSEIAIERDNFIVENEKRFSKLIFGLQKETWDQVERSVLSQLDIENGKVKPTAANLAKLSRFKQIERDLKSGPRKELIEWLLAKLKEQLRMSRKYFHRLLGVGSLAADQVVESRFNAIYGVNKKGFVTRGVLYDLWNDGSDILDIQKQVTKGVISGTNAGQLRSKMSHVVLGKGDKRGIVQANIENKTLDVLPNNDNALQKQYADQLELNFAVYTGGLMDNSRPFCIDRNGEIFHRSEIEAWVFLDWKGKSDPYDPYIDVGGYNCKHVLSWVSNEYAAANGKNLAAYGISE